MQTGIAVAVISAQGLHLGSLRDLAESLLHRKIIGAGSSINEYRAVNSEKSAEISSSNSRSGYIISHCDLVKSRAMVIRIDSGTVDDHSRPPTFVVPSHAGTG